MLTLAFNLLLSTASGSFWPCHQESPNPRSADSKPGHEGSHRCLYPGERLGGGLLKGPPHFSIIPRYSTQKPGQDKDFREQITPLPGYVLYTSGKSHTMDYQMGAMYLGLPLLPTFYLCCKTSLLQLSEARCSWPAAPFKSPSHSAFSILSLLTSSSSLPCFF